MKQITMLAVLLILSLSAISCSEESISGTDNLYDIEATEGDNGHVEQDPDAD